jgi:D-serine deaminase-like pyridoxal phosphate-dependent protein
LSDVISLPPEQIEAAIARIKAEKERRLVEKVEAGEIINMPIFVVAGSESEASAKVAEAKEAKLAELRAAGDQREVVFAVTMAITGVVRPGETADPASVPSAPAFSSREDVAIRPATTAARSPVPPDEVVEEEAGKSPRSSRPTSVFKSANAGTTTILGRSPKVGSVSTLGK